MSSKWRIVLSNTESAYGDQTLSDFPEGFEEIRYGLVRDSIFWGIFHEFAGTLRFIGDGKTFLDGVVTDQGYENETLIYFKKYSETDFVYETIKIARIDFGNIQIMQDYTEVGFVDTAFVTKLRSRYDYEVEFNKPTSIDGTSLPGFSTPYVDLTLRGIAADTGTRAVFPHELFTSIIQQITDSDWYCFDSIIFDRNVDDYRYFAKVLFMNGFFIRGYGEAERKFYISLKFLFEEFSKIIPLGAKIIYNSDNEEVFYVGLRSEMFVSSLVYTFPKSKVLEGMVKEPCKEFMFNEINVGYQSSVKDNSIGASEYNVKAKYSTPLTTFEGKLDAVSRLRADPTAVEDCRTNYARSSGGEDTEESEYDSQIFIVDSIYDTTWKSRELEDIQNSGSAYIYGNLSLYMNIRFTPAHILMAYGDYISVGLQDLTSEQLKILQHEKLSSSFQSQYLSDTAVIYENANINISALATPMFSPHIYRFRCPIEMDDVVGIGESPEGIVKFWSSIDNDWKYGYIEREITTSPIDDATNVHLYEALNFNELFGYLLLFTEGYLKLFSGGYLKLFNND